MQWLTNAHETDVDRLFKELNEGYSPERKLVVDDPKPTEFYSLFRLRQMKMVGIYEK